VVLAAPRTIPDLVAVASLGWSAIRLAEELARAACAALREYGCPQPERVVWRVGERGDGESVVFGRWNVVVRAKGRIDTADDVLRYVDAIDSMWLSGLALDAIDRDAVRIVVPPVGGAR
jgi:hypothetical protein